MILSMELQMCPYKIFIMYFCLYHPENGRDTDNVIKWTLSPCY